MNICQDIDLISFSFWVLNMIALAFTLIRFVIRFFEPKPINYFEYCPVCQQFMERVMSCPCPYKQARNLQKDYFIY